jgi:uracil phosphoribosyltransferase
MTVTIADHPLVGVRLSELRDVATGAARFRALLDDLAALLAPAALQGLAVTVREVTTPLTTTTGTALASPPLLVPVLRAGMGLLPALSRLLPEAPIAMAGLRRDEVTLEPAWYLDKIPADLAGRPVVVLDPMVATGGSLVAVISELRGRAAGPITVLAVLAAPEGVRVVEGCGVDLVVAAIDERLTDAGWIWPGLGDAGDRQTGLV